MKKWTLIGMMVSIALILWALIAIKFFWLATALIILAVVGLQYNAVYLKTRRHRKHHLQMLDIFWWIWLPPLTLAFVSTLAVLMASYAGAVVPGLNWGLRGTPWPYVYFWLLAAWGGVFVVIGLLHRRFREAAGSWLGDFIRTGGCWKIFSTDNKPANRFLVVYALVVLVAVLHGWPRPSVDPQMQVYNAKSGVEWVLNTELVSTVKGKLIYTAETLVGKSIFKAEPFQFKSLSLPEPRYQRSWIWIRISVLLLPLAMIGMALSRRDEAAALLSGVASLIPIRREDASAATAASESPKKGQEDSSDTDSGDAKSQSGTSFATELKKEFAAEAALDLVKQGLKRGLNIFSKMLRKAN